MAKFDRKEQQLKARVLFVRGRMQKQKDAILSDEEVDGLTDETIAELTGTGGPLRAIARGSEAEKPADEGTATETGGEGAAGDGKGGKAK